MAIRREQSRPRPDIFVAAKYFRDCIDGFELSGNFERDAKYLDDTFGILVVSDPWHLGFDKGRTPSAIEMRMLAMALRTRGEEKTFTVEKDGYQAMVWFNEDGKLKVGAWFLDCTNSSLHVIRKQYEEDLHAQHSKPENRLKL